jgi:hypothetical protein
MAVSCDHHRVIEKLLQTLFSSLSYDDKLNNVQHNYSANGILAAEACKILTFTLAWAKMGAQS